MQLVIHVSPDGSFTVVYAVVRVGKLFYGMCSALVCAAAVYKVLRR